MNKSMLINFLLFQLGWFACVLGGAYGQTIIGVVIAIMVIAWHLYQTPEITKELQLLFLAAVAGFIFESLVTATQLAHYSHGQTFNMLAPFWMVLMWPLFATTLNLSLRWLKNTGPVIVALLGSGFAPVAYYAGNSLGAVVYDDLLLSLSVIGAAWAILLPLLVRASVKLDGYRGMATKRHLQGCTEHV